MPLSWNEIKHRAIKFGNDWKTETREAAERQTFWNEFFDIFGIKRRTVASFEEPVKKLSGNWGAIDIFWPGKLLGEHKSAGQDLDKAHAQGMGYIRGLQDTGRGKEIPRYLVVSDFQKIALHDLEGKGESISFPVTELHKHIRHFAFIAGYKQHKLDPEDPANIEAAELMADLHDALHDGGYTGHDLRVFLVRTLFCLFADDTGIFPPDSFKLYLTDRTAEDGSDLGPKLDRLFRILNTPEDKRQAALEEDLRQFPYVNGQLFEEKLEFADFTTAMRAALLKAAQFRWERISPAVFGSLFQGVMDAKDRRQVGAHYTSEANILKLIRSLFLDDMRAEFDHLRGLKIGKADKLRDLQKRLAALRFMDPACGCGNFLVITYRELRRLELDILKELHGQQSEFGLDEVNKLSLIDVDQMYGIEIEEFPGRIAEVALWLTDHQANVELSQAFSQFYLRIPLRKSPHIHVANALRKDWKEVLPPEQCSYILGNPPFVGKKEQSADQKADFESVWRDTKNAGSLDFVTCWHRLASEYIQGTKIKVAFVSTNSICQGEQVGILWSALLHTFNIRIQFAHRTFPWDSEARGKAHVHVIIVGFGLSDTPAKRLYDYDLDRDNPSISVVTNISPYLLDAGNTVVTKRMRPLCQVPEMDFGSKAADFGHLVLSPEERNNLISAYPFTAPWIREFIGSEEFINGSQRFCLWFKEVRPEDLRNCPPVLERLEKCREERAKSVDANTRRWAAFPSLFQADRQPSAEYLLVPKVSSERRQYVPLGFLPPTVITNPSVLVVPGATIYHFGVLSAQMHMAWMRQTCGRMKSDYQYSNTIVYNNYPWPEALSEAQKAAVEKAAQAVLDVREVYLNPRLDEVMKGDPAPQCTLADLYDPTTMPPALAKAHADLDRAVDRCYRKEPFPNDRARVEHLFALYEKLSVPLACPVKKRRPSKKNPCHE